MGVNQGGPVRRPLLQIVSPQQLAQQDQQRASAGGAHPDQMTTALAGFIRERWQVFKNHRSTSALDKRLLDAQRTFNGEYDPSKLMAIKQFGGSEIYARIVAVKCRGATSLLRDVYLGAERPWEVAPTPDPTTPSNIDAQIMMLVRSEVQNLQANAVPVNEDMVRERVSQLREAAQAASRKKAYKEAENAQLKLDDMLVEGNFYTAFAEFLVDLPLFPYAVIKGPVVRIVPDVRWVNGVPAVVNQPRMFWERVSPFDFYFDPGVSNIADGAIIEKIRVSRTDLNDCIGLPGYDDEAIYAVLDEHGRGGLVDWITSTDSQRAQGENRENPHFNQSHMIDTLEFHGPVQARALVDYGFPPEELGTNDLLRDVYIQAWMIGRHIIKVQISPSPRRRHPYYVTSFEKVPGTPIGNGLPDILSDMQDWGNATLRSLINNMSISSGPQVVVEQDQLTAQTDPNTLYPWKRWFVLSNPNAASGARGPVSFFQPNSHASELLGVYEKILQISDELSAIPRYTTGSERTGGAGRTASGLAMLMGNASKILQTVAANVDRDVLDPSLQFLYDILMMTDGGKTFRGDEAIRVKGVATAMAREAEKAQALQFLQITANEFDMQIIGPIGRAAVLRKVSKDLNMPEQVVPDTETLRAQMQAQAAVQAQPQPGEGEGGEGTPKTAQNAAPTPGRPQQDAQRRLDLTQRQDPRSLPAPSGVRVG